MNGFAKRMMAVGAQRLAQLPLAPLLRCMSSSDRNVLHVLTYHRVDWPEARPDLSPATLSTTPTNFAAQMECLRDEFCAINLEQVCDAVLHKRPLPRRALLITFDDAYCDFRQHAWPVLRRLGLPVVVFVPTQFADDPSRGFWWDRLHRSLSQAPEGACVKTSLGMARLGTAQQRKAVFGRLIRNLSSIAHREALNEVERIVDSLPLCAAARAVLNWDELRALASEGVALAPHTRSHPLLNRIPMEEARREAIGSRNDLMENIGRCPPAFAYPNGASDNCTRAMLANEGFKIAFSTRRGANALMNCDAFQLRRINVGFRTTAEMIVTQLSLPPLLLNALCR